MNDSKEALEGIAVVGQCRRYPGPGSNVSEGRLL
jgi:hypothetical protein